MSFDNSGYIDRLEFSKALRIMDIAEELSYLCMECEMMSNKEYYSIEQGLSNQPVTSILKDNEGFMWFGKIAKSKKLKW